MDSMEQVVKEALDGLEALGLPRELWPMVVAAVVEARRA